MAKRPKWQLRALRQIRWRAALLLTIGYVIIIAVAYVFRAPDQKPVPQGLLTMLPWLFALIFGINTAYLRGVKDGQTHAKSDQPSEHI